MLTFQSTSFHKINGFSSFEDRESEWLGQRRPDPKAWTQTNSMLGCRNVLLTAGSALDWVPDLREGPWREISEWEIGWLFERKSCTKDGEISKKCSITPLPAILSWQCLWRSEWVRSKHTTGPDLLPSFTSLWVYKQCHYRRLWIIFTKKLGEAFDSEERHSVRRYGWIWSGDCTSFCGCPCRLLIFRLLPDKIDWYRVTNRK